MIKVNIIIILKIMIKCLNSKNNNNKFKKGN